MATKDLSILLSQLNISTTVKNDQTLYQVIKELIDHLKALQGIVNTFSSGTTTDLTALLSAFFLLSLDESPTFPNSRQLLAGQNIEFDDTVANERTVNTGNWSVLTNGDPVTPELIFDSNGDVIMTYNP